MEFIATIAGYLFGFTFTVGLVLYIIEIVKITFDPDKNSRRIQN